ncbi:MAG: hypothetical protein HY326_10140 [Chloroflexi bacterium]|nr:hypothetical protein [Chloroflexota bacterium]
MSESNTEDQPTSISKAKTVGEIAEFWDTHSLADYWDQTHEVEFEVKAIRRPRVALDPEVFARIEEQARRRGILPETLINLWLLERLQQPT